uniref:Uncharacterized protein n=1 Tax=Arundo donax TaxID=35708 RepID=A0A0A9AZM9_ARUDO
MDRMRGGAEELGRKGSARHRLVSPAAATTEAEIIFHRH